MKISKINRLIVAVLAVATSASTAFGQYYTVNALPMCWTTAAGVDSTIYMTQLDATQKTKPERKYFYNAQGNAVNRTGGTLRWGRCTDPSTDSLTVRLDILLEDNDTLIAYLQNLINIQNQITVNLDSLAGLLDSIAGNTEQPQQCTCLYSIDLENPTSSAAANAMQAVYNYEKVVTRNCGAGAEEIYRQPGFALGNKTYHQSNAILLVSGSSVLDSMKLHVVNPTDSFVVYLSPAMVALKYPSLLSTIDTALLRYNTATLTGFKTTVAAVFTHATNVYAVAKGIASPRLELEVLTLSGNNVGLRFYIVNNPSGPYINIRTGTYFLKYHRTSATAETVTTFQYAGVLAYATETYTTPCGLVANVQYQAPLLNVLDVQNYIDSLVLITPVAPTQILQLDKTCIQQCPTGGACIEICQPASNPIPVTIIDTDCLVLNRVEFPANITSTSATLPANYYHSVTIEVTSGTVTVSAVNGASVTSRSFSSGSIFNVSARECELLPTSFIINAASGAASVATIR